MRRVFRKRWTLPAGVVFVALALAAGWMLRQALEARHDLEVARTDLAAARAAVIEGDLDAGRAAAGRAVRRTSEARKATSGPLWRAASHIPLLGNSVRSTRIIVGAADALSSGVVQPLVAVSGSLNPAALRTAPATVDVAPLARAAPVLDQAVVTGTRVKRDLQAAPHRLVPQAIDDARLTLETNIDELMSTLRPAAAAARILPVALGQKERLRWFIALQTPAEARGTGGLMGGVMIASVSRGKITFETVEPNDNLDLDGNVRVELPAEYHRRWDPWSPTDLAVNGGVSPHFPYAARIWSAEWQQRYDTEIDGVAAVDPIVLGHLLAALGPVTLSDGTTLDGSSVTDFVLVEQYARYPAQKLRNARLRELMAKTLALAVGGASSARDLVTALGKGVNEGRVLVSMPKHATSQRILEQFRIAGALPPATAPAWSVIINDAGGSKLGPYLTRDINYTAAMCTTDRSGAVLTVKLGNTAPASGLPRYVTSRADAAAAGKRFLRGQRRDYVSVYAPAGWSFESATLDGRPLGMEIATERGHPVFSAYVTDDPGQTRRIAINVSGPRTAGVPRIQTQPLVNAARVSVDNSLCMS